MGGAAWATAFWMNEYDDKFMNEAIEWAAGCNPIKDAIPKVGAIIAIGSEVIGRGRRGCEPLSARTGTTGESAERKIHRLPTDPWCQNR